MWEIEYVRFRPPWGKKKSIKKDLIYKYNGFVEEIKTFKWGYWNVYIKTTFV